MSDEELINETMMLDYSQLVMHNVYMIKENKRLKDQLQQKENIIKEVREYIEKLANLYDDNYTITDKAKDILEILDKVGDIK